jgi:hypothetical protein
MLKILVIQGWVLFFLMGDLGVVVFVNCECSVLSLQWQRVVIASLPEVGRRSEAITLQLLLV